MLKNLLKKLIPQGVINYFWHLPKAYLASRLYNYPEKDLKIIAVTGTDGKTTTATMLHHILASSGKKVGLITTVEAKINNESIDTGLHVTCPNPFKLKKIFSQMKSKNIRYVILEATSHGIDQHRLFPIKPEIAILTNITHEHIDYHKTFDKYVSAKLKLLKNAKNVVVNKDAEIYSQLKNRLKKPFSTYSIKKKSQLQAKKVNLLKTKTKFKIGNITYELPLTGKYNIYNALAAISAALFLDISPANIKSSLSTFPGIKGRLEKINKKNRTIIIDFAHTPNALKNALQNLKNIMPKDSRLIAVFGSAGLRDKGKRPKMGNIAARIADEIVITAEDPRTEDIDVIINDIKKSIPKKYSNKVHSVKDRQDAITLAITQIAKKGDWVGIFGKGHERSMCYGRKEHPWSDHKAVKKALKKL